MGMDIGMGQGMDVYVVCAWVDCLYIHDRAEAGAQIEKEREVSGDITPPPIYQNGELFLGVAPQHRISPDNLRGVGIPSGKGSKFIWDLVLSEHMMYEQQLPQPWGLKDVWRRKEDSNPRPSNKQNGAHAVVHLVDEEEEDVWLEDVVGRYHSRSVSKNECCSVVMQRIEAPVSVVWSVVRRFDEPQTYKHFVRSCLMEGDGRVGSVREVRVVSGLPAATSTERLEILDDERHIMSFRIVGGDHRLNNYRSITTLHETVIKGRPATIAIESYVVEVPEGNTKEDTCLFIDTIVKCNLHSLAQISHGLNT
eukprot:Gb_26331 [translate_table: standard]